MYTSGEVTTTGARDYADVLVLGDKMCRNSTQQYHSCPTTSLPGNLRCGRDRRWGISEGEPWLLREVPLKHLSLIKYIQLQDREGNGADGILEVSEMEKVQRVADLPARRSCPADEALKHENGTRKTIILLDTTGSTRMA